MTETCTFLSLAEAILSPPASAIATKVGYEAWSAEVGTQRWHFVQLLEATASRCNVRWFQSWLLERVLREWSVGADPVVHRRLGVSPTPVWQWSVEWASVFAFFNWDLPRMYPGVHEEVREQKIDGATWMGMGVQDYIDYLGMSHGTAVNHGVVFRDFIALSFRGPPIQEDGSPATVHLHVAVERLIDVEPPSSFQVNLFISMSWRDLRITRNCQGVSADVFDPTDVCTVFWQPQWTYPTSLCVQSQPSPPQHTLDFFLW